MALTPIETGSIPLMREIAKAANMEFAHIKKMILVLDCDDVPRLFCESFISTPGTGFSEALAATSLKPEMLDTPMIVDVSSMLNEEWRTKAVIKREEEDGPTQS